MYQLKNTGEMRMDKIDKSKKLDRRTIYTRNIIKESLLKLAKKKPFEKITVTEVCKLCEINRGTFYIHYCDLYDVLNDLFDEMLEDVFIHLNILYNDEKSRCTYPLCKIIQEDTKYNDLLFNDSLTNYIINKIISKGKNSFINNIMNLCNLPYEQAQSILIFQINGCFAINKYMYKTNKKKWCEIQCVIDKFIEGGLKNTMV